jgi:hypothetical protein
MLNVDIGKDEQWVAVIYGKTRLWAQGLPLDLQRGSFQVLSVAGI